MHWFPVVYRSQYNMFVYAYKDIMGLPLSSKRMFVVAYHLTRSLKAEFGALLTVSQTCSVMYDNIYFGKAAATLWNHLPVNVRKCRILHAFKKVMKNVFISAFLT